MMLVSFLCVVLGIGVTAGGGGADRCARTVSPDGGRRVLCHVRTMDADGSLTSLPTDDTTRLSIECNKLLLFESNLQAHYFHKFPKLAELSISNCKFLRIPGNAFEGLPELKTLKVKSENSEWSANKNLELSLGALNGLRELQTLDVGFNNIRNIPSDVFCALDNLRILNLTNNRLRAVDRLGFGQGCGSNVQSLDLTYNDIKNLPDESDIVRLKRLEILNLQHNNITDISAASFEGLLSLRMLNLSYNQIQTLPEGLFASCRELREIYLNRNLLFELAKGVFHRLEQLIVLDLSSNQLSSNHIDAGTFIGLIRLIVLNLSNNALTRIDGKSFKDLFFLQILDLRNNSIGYIEDNAFLPLYNLHTLNLAENRLHTIDEHLFNGLYVLSKLTLNNNLLVNIDPRAFKNCSDVKELDLSSNQIKEIPRALSELPFLKTLDLGENQISDFTNGSFKNLGQLTGLRLIDNQIGNISLGMFWDLPSLQVLNLAKNKIHNIERGTFTRNGQLEAIRLDGNFVSDINGVFSSLASLLWLNLSENHLVWFDYAFIPSNLKWLDIHGNFIEHLGNYYKIQEEIRVKTLDASHNRIVEISPMAIPNSVELLFINNNLIKTVQVNTFSDKVNLTRVDMYANEIVQMDLHSLRLSPVPISRNLPEFYIGGNPFQCDCAMEWLPLINNMTSMRQHPRVMDLENVLCKVTHTRSGTHVPLISLQPSNFLCKYDTHCFALCHCCDFDACDCEMTCPQNCSCYHDPTWNSNVVDCSGQRVHEIPHRIPMDATEVYLDGNYFSELLNHAFIGRKNMRTLFVNSSGIENIQNRTFAGLNALRVLHLEDNKLKVLKGFEFEHLSNLKELFLQNNIISHIVNNTFSALMSLELLRLDGNRLADFSVLNLGSNMNLNNIWIGNNLWSCKCRNMQQLTGFIADNAHKIIDISDMWCWSGDSKPPIKMELNLNGTACSDYYAGGSVIDNMLVSDYLPMVVSALTGLMLLILAIGVLFLFRDTISIWMYSSCGLRLFSFASAFEDGDKLYDAYVCYSPKDEDFVIQTLASELETGEPPHRLCLHYRDIPHHGGQYVQSPPLAEAADASKRVILVLTRNFLETEWSRYEYRQVLQESLKGRMFKVVLVEETLALPEAECDPDLQPYLKMGTRIRWGQKRFWERLRYALPELNYVDRSAKLTNYRRNLNAQSLESSVANGVSRTFSFADKPCSVGGARGEPEYYCDAAEQHLSSVYGGDGRPHSDHIYSSIDSDYSTLERGGGGGRRREPRHWPPPPPLLDPAASRAPGQAYLV